jgi:hypothetical protein
MMSLSARRELAAEVASRYRTAGKSERTSLLDDFVANTQYNRKHAICVLRKAMASSLTAKAPARRSRRRTYGPEVERAFLELWRVSGCLCPKRLMPFLADLIDALERFDEISLCPGIKDKLLVMSVSTAERILGRCLRSRERGISTTLPGTLLRQQIPIRTYEEWTEDRPGFTEIDLVAHCGGTAAGDYLYTLTVTDIFTGWTECFALRSRSQIAVCAALEAIRKRLPFALLGIDSDNGSEFINNLVKRYCDDHDITFTRCRPYKKNDQCHVEQKNGAVVRPLVGYARYETDEAAVHLNRLYQVHRLCVNFFEPSMKLTGKSRQGDIMHEGATARLGARVKKSYDQAKTPWQRLMAAEGLSPEARERLRQQFLSLNPAQLRRDLTEIEMGLRRFAVDNPTIPAMIAPQDKNASPGRSNRNVTLAEPDARKEGGSDNGPAA